MDLDHICKLKTQKKAKNLNIVNGYILTERSYLLIDSCVIPRRAKNV